MRDLNTFNKLLKTVNLIPKYEEGGGIPTIEEMRELLEAKRQAQRDKAAQALAGVSGVDLSEDASWRDTGLTQNLAVGMGVGAQAATQVANAVDTMVMGNKNFGTQSLAVDTAVHGVSSALMKSGNPYAQAAGAALEVANFATKATGDSVAGFDVNINSSGYGNMGHKGAKANRDWGAAIGLGGLFNKGKMDAQLALRNREMLMALKAANIAEDVKFEQEARANSVENVLQANQQALDGGIDTSLLAS